MPNDVWPMVHAERAALIDDLQDLDAAQWRRRSLCDGWTVHDVVAHLVDTAMTTRLGFVADMVRARFDFDRQNARGVQRRRGASPQETLDRLRQVASRTSTPPAAVVRSLRQQARTSTAFGGAKELISGVGISATDVELSIGDGPEVRGPALALLLVLSGRLEALEQLEGPGVATLTATS
ncbi:MAG: hypothetical protein QOD90_5219 [Mycobacterium sp.]|nr:hypothetical protein [Mycobacterium sp.]